MKFILLLMPLFFAGCIQLGYEKVYIDNGEPFVISEIIENHDKNGSEVIFKTEVYNGGAGNFAQIVLPHDYGYKVGDTVRILDMRSIERKE